MKKAQPPFLLLLNSKKKKKNGERKNFLLCKNFLLLPLFALFYVLIVKDGIIKFRKGKEKIMHGWCAALEFAL